MYRVRGLLDCPVCLRAAVVLMIAIAMLSAIILALWLPAASAGPGIALQVCEQATCASISAKGQKALGGTGALIIQPASIVSIAGIPECAGCTKIALERGATVYVLGTPQTVACKLFGGDKCKAD